MPEKHRPYHMLYWHERPDLPDIPSTDPWDSKEEVARKARLFQQRVLLLHHAKHCAHEEPGACPVSPHCGFFKALQKYHMGDCNDSQCSLVYCAHSR